MALIHSDDCHSPRPDAQTPLLDDTVDGAVDYRGRPVRRSTSGGWRSAVFVIGVGVAERFAYFGVISNLITFLSGPLGEPTATAAVDVNTWSGTAAVLPLLAAIVADSFLGRYRTILISSLLYILGLGCLTFSAMLPSITAADCEKAKTQSSSSSCYSQLQVIFVFFSLYLVAVGQGGARPCFQALGADQFDSNDPEECKAKSSFFNWWYFGTCSGTLATRLISSYIQDNLSWVVGFGIPCLVMLFGVFIFLIASKTYRYSVVGRGQNPFVRIGKVFVAAFRNRRAAPADGDGHLQPHQTSQQFKFLDKALVATSDNMEEERKICSVYEVEQAKVVLGLVPIWVTCLGFTVVLAQFPTFFTKEGATMDRTIFPGFDIPAASLQSFISLTIVLLIPVYDRVFVPLAATFTGKPSGITTLQRIGTGIFLAIISLAVAALAEIKRLKTAEKYGLLDDPTARIPMSVWWLVPSYLIIGVADVFTVVGLQEFFYDQVPKELRSVGVSLYMSIFGVGNFMSSFLVSVIEEATSGGGRESWFANNLNRAHLDYFYWVLAGMSAVTLAVFIYFSRSYMYRKGD